MRNKTATVRGRRGARHNVTRVRSSLQHANDIALLSAPVAARRLWDLRGATPFAASAAMNRFAIEKTVAFASAWWAASFAAVSVQLRWWRAAARFKSTNAAKEWETITRTALKPIAAKVRHNSALR